MNPRLELLKPYPFERLAALKTGVKGNPAHPHIALSIGEPRHEPPRPVTAALTDRASLTESLASYPATRGLPELREQAARWAQQRFNAELDPDTQVLPVAGTREALFSFGQAVLGRKPGGCALLPNPFYQIYEGAVLLAGCEPYYVNADARTGFLPDFRSVPESVWRRCELVYTCSPGNPTGRCLDLAAFANLLELAERYDFIVAADECYSEIYLDVDQPPLGLLDAARQTGRDDYRRCVVFHSLSKRSNLPGLRSGFVAGDARILDRYYTWRTYEGCALPHHVQQASRVAWAEESHVQANRELYRAKFAAVTPLLARAFDVVQPEGGFYHWLDVTRPGEARGDDQAFARDLFAAENITVLPGSFLSRPTATGDPGAGYIRVAWVASLAECVDAAERLAAFAAGR